MSARPRSRWRSSPQAVTAAEQQYPMEPGSPMSRETLRRLDDTGLEVRDVEFLTLRPDTGPTDWKPALDAGAALGARTLSAVGADPDRSRPADTLAALPDDARPLGLRPTLEPIRYQPVSTVAEAAALASGAGAALLLDALHVQRGGSSIDDVRALDPISSRACSCAPAPWPLPHTSTSRRSSHSGCGPTARCCRSRPGSSAGSSAKVSFRWPSWWPTRRPGRHSASRSPTRPCRPACPHVDFARRNLRAVRDLLEEVGARD
jgi:hypothetical protein